MKLSGIFKRLLRSRECMRECGEFEPAPTPRDDRPSIDMLTAKYNDAVDIMNQQTAALLAACGVLQTYSVVPLDKRLDIHEAIAEGCLEVCRAAVARAESFPTPKPENRVILDWPRDGKSLADTIRERDEMTRRIIDRPANPEPIPVERHCHPHEMGKADASPPPSPDDEFAAHLQSVISEFKQKSDPRQPPNARLMIALLGRESVASSPLTYIDDRHPSKYDSVPPPVEDEGCNDRMDAEFAAIHLDPNIKKKDN